MLRAEKAAPGNSSPDAWFWLMPHLVAVWIYWEAVLLMSKARSLQQGGGAPPKGPCSPQLC